MEKTTMLIMLFCVSAFSQQKGALTDPRDGKKYKTVKIGDQWWMAENLKYEASGSRCYHDNESYCSTFGRLYDWNTAMNGSPTSTSTPSGVRGVCPPDWHLPSNMEWTKLTDYVGSDAGTKLKKFGLWYNIDNCTDDFGFSAQPGGYGNGSEFLDIIDGGYWWTATASSDTRARYLSIHDNSSVVSSSYLSKTLLLSIRYVKD